MAVLKETSPIRDMTRSLRPSPDAAKRYLLDLLGALAAIRCYQSPTPECVAWPAGLDRSILEGLPLRVRTRNCLMTAGLMEGDSRLTVSQLLRLKNFGQTSLRDLLRTVEVFLRGCIPIEAPQPPSRDAAQRHLLDLHDALAAIHRNRRPTLECVAWPAGLDRRILERLPLHVRTRNCLVTARLMEGDSGLTVSQLVRLRSFGQTSLRDLVCAVEDFLKECIVKGDAQPRESGESSQPTATDSTGSAVHGSEPLQTPWESAGQILSPLLASAAEIHGAKTLADALNPEFMHLAGQMRTASRIAAITIDDVIGETPGLVSATLSRLSQTLDAASATERTVIERRLLDVPEASLGDIASSVGVTREWVRQLQIKIEQKLQYALGDGVQIITSTLKGQIGSVVESKEVDCRLEELLGADQDLATRVLRRALIDGLDLTLNDGIYLDARAQQQLREIRAAILEGADDVGLVNAHRIIAGLPSDEWRRFWPWLRKQCGLCTFHGSICIRDTKKARAKAALISIGRPSTAEEIDRLCGFGATRMRSHLSVIQSVVRADRNRWGLKEWVDDEYEGIVGEIIQRIKEDGGATTTERLLTELPAKFGVSPISVKAYMQTPKFAVEDGWISLAGRSSVKLQSLDDVIDGRDQSGAPYWTFAVESRFLSGYSLPGVPPELAKALGCEPDSNIRVRIENLPECPDLSMRWSLSSTNGASIGYLAEPLHELGLQAGKRARVTLKGAALVDLSANDRDGSEEPRMRRADEILDRMMQRRKVL